VVAMFAPSFFTGGLIRRFGVIPVMLAGAALNFAAIAFALGGIAVSSFWWALVMLGVGWNFLYIGATTMLTETYRPEELARAQGANEFAIFAMMTLSSLSSGMIVTNAGWEKLNYAALPLIVVVAVALVTLGVRQRRMAA
jgi:MFS family permease